MALTQVPAALLATDVPTTASVTAAATAAATAGNVKLSGDLVQSVSYSTGAMATGTTTIPLDDTLPQITEGTEFLTVAITPTIASNTLEIEVLLNGANSGATNNLIGALFQDSTANALTCSTTYMASNNIITPLRLLHRMTAGTTSATTFRVRAGGNAAGTMTLNGAAGARYFGGALLSTITVRELKA